MASGFTLSITTADVASFMKSRIYWANESPANLVLIKRAIRGILAGTFLAGNGSVNIGSAVAVGLCTISTGDFAANDTVTINGTAFTAKASTTANNEFNIGASITATAANLVAAILASSTKLIAQTILPTSSAGVVTLTSRIPGIIGNTTATGGLFTLAKSGTNVAVTAFVGGTDDSSYNFTV